MGRQSGSAIVSGAGYLCTLFTELMKAVLALGGSESDLHRLVTPEGEEVVRRIANVIVSAGKPVDPQAQIKALFGNLSGRRLEATGIIDADLPHDRDYSGIAFTTRRIKREETIASFLNSITSCRESCVTPQALARWVAPSTTHCLMTVWGNTWSGMFCMYVDDSQIRISRISDSADLPRGIVFLVSGGLF